MGDVSFRCESCPARSSEPCVSFGAMVCRDGRWFGYAETPRLWREGWTALAGGDGHFWICPACASTPQESRALLALRGVRVSRSYPFWMPLRYHALHALWVVEASLTRLLGARDG